MQRSIGIIFVGFLLLAGRVLSAQEAPRVINFDPAGPGGISQNWMIAQSERGRMYFAQSEGLTSFDGQNWQRFQLPHRQIVRAAATDRQDRIYVGGYGEFGYWEELAGHSLKYTSLSDNLEDNASWSSEEIWHIVVWDKGVIFQSFSKIFYYDFKSVRPFIPPGNIMFIQQVHNRIVVPVIGRGLYYWDPLQGFEPLAGTEQLPAQRVKGLLPLDDQGLLIATEQQGLWVYRQGKISPWNNQAQSAFKAYQINKAQLLSNGLMAFGTILNGLIVLDKTGKLQFHLHQRNGLQNNTVLSLYEDRHADLWVGLDQGADLIAFSDPLRYYIDKGGQLGSLYAAAQHQGRLYVGSNQGVYHRSLTAANNIGFELLKGTQGQVWALHSQNNSLFIGHNDGAFSLENDRLETVSTVTGGWQMLVSPHNPNLAVQCTYTGLVVLERHNGGRWNFARRLEGLLAPLRQMAFDKAGYLWVVHASKGIYRLQLDSNFSHIEAMREWGESEGLPDTYAMSIVSLGDTLLFRSGAAYYVFDAATYTFRRIQSFRGQALPLGCYVIQGQQDDWFIALSDGVHWIRKSQLLGRLPLQLVTGYPKVEYLSSRQYLFCLRDGYALLPAEHQLSLPRYAPKPEVSLVVADLAHTDSLIHMPHQTHLVFPSHTSSIKFYFSQAIYSERIRFRYRLKGFDLQWSDWTSLNQKEFTNLPFGQYTLELQSDHSDAIVPLSFTVLPHWSQTWLARFCYLLLILLGWWLLYRAHRRRLRLQARRMIIERERSVQQERIRTQNAQLEADVLRKSQELANSTFSLVQKNEILIQIKDELGEIKSELGSRMPERHYQRLQRLIDSHMTNEQDWQIFETNFNEVHNIFFKKLKHDFPELSPGDLRLAAYLKMNLSSKEIAPLLNISVRGIENKRYRLRQKLALTADANLTEFLMNY